MKKLLIENYHQLENLTLAELEDNCTEKGNYKDYTYYFIDTQPYYDLCLIVVGNNKIIYIDEQLQYSEKLTQEQVKEKMLTTMQSKIFDLTEFGKVANYKEYLNKLDFLNNIYRHLFNSVSVYNGTPTKEEKAIIDKGFYAKKIAFCYFEKQEELALLDVLYSNLEDAIKECLQDEEQQKKAIEYEIINHETMYSHELGELAFLMSYGIKAQTIKNVYAEFCRTHELY